VSRRWAFIIQQQLNKLPETGQVYRLRTIPQENKKGSWFGWQVTPDGSVRDIPSRPLATEALKAANIFRKAVEEGRAKATPPAEGHQAEGEEVPF
jgi:hypothetical protein